MNEFTSTIRLLEDSAFFYIICTDTNGLYSYINNNYKCTFKYIADNLVGQPYYITMHPDDMKVCEEVAHKCIQSPGKTFPATIRKHDGNGGYIITQWEYKAMFDEAGVLQGIFCIGFDVTELNRKADLLKEIAFQQSHLVRRPLANIMGITGILNKLEVDENVRSLVDMLVQSSQELDNSISFTVHKTYE